MNDKQNKLFRKVSLDRLSSPEQLDQLIQVTTPKSWVAVLALIAGIVVALIWGIFGSIPTQIQGQAVFIRTGGLQAITVPNAGRLSDIAVRPGDIVTQGQLIARLAQSDLRDELNNARARQLELEQRLARLSERNRTQQALRGDLLAEQRETLREQIRILGERLEAQRSLLNDGLITRQEYLNTRQSLSETRNKLEQLGLTEFEGDKELELERQAVETELAAAERRIVSLSHRLSENAQLRSPYTGRVVELSAESGALVQPGTPILLLERTGRAVKKLEAVIYVSAQNGKRIDAGSEALLSPAGVKREEFGYMRGRVTSVSEYAATAESMMQVLENEQMVQDLLRGGAVFQVRADLIPDPDTPSGFAWTSADGPPHEIRSGNLGSAQITVRRQRPISLVIPMLREWSGL